MNESQEFSFGDDSVASAYDNLLVPVLFEPWAFRMVEALKPWTGLHVLDLATGTGIVARQLGNQVGPSGKVIGVDINAQMLSLAKKRCSDLSAVEFIECPADNLKIPSGSIDYVVCQQGFQFFPDKHKAAREIYRVLKGGGKIVATTWCTVDECEYFGSICKALEDMGESQISEMMRTPFDFILGSDLIAQFESIGFNNIELRQQEQNLVFDGGISSALDVAYSTPIGPKLRALPDNRQDEFLRNLTGYLNELSTDGKTMGRMVSNIISAEKSE